MLILYSQHPKQIKMDTEIQLEYHQDPQYTYRLHVQ